MQRSIKAPKLEKDDAVGWRKEAIRQRKALVTLTTNVKNYVAHMDRLMSEPSSAERGKKVAELTNTLAMANDHARYFALDIDWRRDKPAKV
jgi:hypothetical protein